MKKDLLQKEQQKEIKRFRRKRKLLQLQIFGHQQKLNLIQFFAVPEVAAMRVQYRISELLSDMESIEKSLEEEAFYRLYMREDYLRGKQFK